MDSDTVNESYTTKKKNGNTFVCIVYSRKLSTSIYRVTKRIRKSFKISCIRVHMSYHGLNNLAQPHNGYVAAKTGWGIHSCGLMDVVCNFSNTSKVNDKCVFGGKYHKMYNI